MKKILLQLFFCTSIWITSQAQVIFHDVNPDVTLNQLTSGEVSYYVDINNDGDTDFQIINSYNVIGDSTYSKTIVLADSGNAVAVDAFEYPLALTADIMVDQSLTFQSQNFGPLKKVTSQFGVGISFGGNWIDATDRFLGVRFMENDTLKYGWIEMVMNTNQATVVTTILDFAYENSGAGILTQDSLGAIGINEISFANDIQIYSYQHTAVIKYNELSVGQLHVRITDVWGREIKFINTEQKEMQIDLSGFSGNLLVITAEAGNTIVSRKIVVM